MNESSRKRQLSYFRQAMKLQEAANGVVVQRVMANDLRRLLYDPDPEDMVASALTSERLRRTFQHCDVELGKDALRSSLEGIVTEAADDRKNGVNGEGCALLVWRMERSSSPSSAGGHFSKPELVGLATLFRMKDTSTFTTTEEDFAVKSHFQKLLPYVDGQNANTVNAGKRWEPEWDVKSKYMYIDVMCSRQKGVGRLLVLHAYRYAVLKRTKGVLALSYSKRKVDKNKQPASYKIFNDMDFETIVSNAQYKNQMYGHWVVKSTHRVSFTGMIEHIESLCTRGSYKDSRTRVWRCPS